MSMLLLVPMLLQVFPLLLPPLLLVSMLVHAVAGTHAIAGISPVVGPIIGGVLNSIMISLLLLVLHLPMPEKSSIPWLETFYIPPRRKILVVPAP
jgi:hypothetical protein